MSKDILISYEELKAYFIQVLHQHEVAEDRSEIIATIFADSTADGFHSHGANRFPEFIQQIRDGHIDKDATPELVLEKAFFERYDGQLGPGPYNAHYAMQRAVALAKTQGMGLVGLRRNNHWMRGGSYGWQAANAGCMGLCWTNTKPNMVPWGAKKARTGNNPFIIAIPRQNGHMVLDTSLSQFSYGQMKNYARRGEQLPFQGGYNKEGELTTDPRAIYESELAIPIGYWKGGALSIMLNALAAVLAAGKETGEIGTLAVEHDLSQVFLAIDARFVNLEAVHEEILDRVTGYINASEPREKGGQVSYPGQRTLQRRRKYMREGIPIDAAVWAGLQDLLV